MKFKLEWIEKWKKIEYEGEETRYSISNMGQARNDDTGQLMKVSINVWGYAQLSIFVKDKRVTMMTHRLVAEYFVPNNNPEKRTQVHHLDDIKIHNEFYNLNWLSKTQHNQSHALFKNQNSNKEWQSKKFSKYSDDQIHKICQLVINSDKINISNISNETGVSEAMIRHLLYWDYREDISKQYNLKSYMKEPKGEKKEIIKLIEQGKTSKEIVALLGLEKKKKTYKRILYLRNKMANVA